MKTKDVLLPSAHLLELFMPYRRDEARMLDVLKRIEHLGYYKGFELGVMFDRRVRRAVRDLVEGGKYNLTTFITPYLKDQNLSLCSINSEERVEAVRLALELVELSAEQGVKNLGIPSGDDPGEKERENAKYVLSDVIDSIALKCREYNINLTIEPLDRYAFKKQLIGPIEETMEWFKPIHQRNPNFFIHWDSAHEALGGIDLQRSLDFAKGYIAQFHLCNCITDKKHPCYGDLHMDVGVAPSFATEGFLTPAVGADILKKVASFGKPQGVADVFVSVEVLGHPGNDLYRKEIETRNFLNKCYELADKKEVNNDRR